MLARIQHSAVQHSAVQYVYVRRYPNWRGIFVPNQRPSHRSTEFDVFVSHNIHARKEGLGFTIRARRFLRPTRLRQLEIEMNWFHIYIYRYFKDTTPHWSTRGKLRNRLVPYSTVSAPQALSQRCCTVEPQFDLPLYQRACAWVSNPLRMV